MFQKHDPDTWREWLIAGFGEWRSAWFATLNQFSENPAVNSAIATFRAVPDRPQFEQVARALSEIRAADETDSNWPRGSKKSVRAALKDFLAKQHFSRRLPPLRARIRWRKIGSLCDGTCSRCWK
jgi:hypothetical protein